MSSIYDSPQSDLDEGVKNDFRLFKISGIGLATFFGTILAGGILMAINYRRLGKLDSSKKALIYSALATVGVFVLVFFIPEDINIPNSVFTLPQLFAMVQIAKKYQQEDIDQHTESGGEMSSNWKAFGISILTIVILMIAIISIIFITT